MHSVPYMLYGEWTGNDTMPSSINFFSSPHQPPTDRCRANTDRRIIWTAAIFAIQSFVTQESLRAPKDASSPLATLGYVSHNGSR